ncbi:MAG: hypothetical protein GY932_06865 [Arcobacter sp.]|nr:hypothetical protein [Flavobacteriaceae bacterium]MCP4970294.1 hypothetical protein [Arcobacter sp.]
MKSKTKTSKKNEKGNSPSPIIIVIIVIFFIAIAFGVYRYIKDNGGSEKPEKQIGSGKPNYMGYCVIDSSRCGPKGFELGDKSPIKLVTTPYNMPPLSEMPSGMLIVPETEVEGKRNGPLRDLPMIFVNYAQSVLTGPGEAMDQIIPIIQKYNKPPNGTHRMWKNYGLGALLQIVAIDYNADDLTFREIPNNPNNTLPGGKDSANLLIVNETSVVDGCDSNSMCVVRKF